LSALDSDTIVGFVGRGVERLVASSLERAAPQQATELRPRALALFTQRYAMHALDHTVPYAGVPEALRRLKGAARHISVLTNKPRRPALAILDALGLAPFVDDIVAGDDAFARKPDPEGLLHLMSTAGIGPEATVVVGDSAVDVETARAAGVDACAVTWGFDATGATRVARARCAVDHPAELQSIAPEGRVE